MKATRSLALALIFAPAAAGATNVCDFKDCLAQERAKAAAQAAALKAKHDFQVRVDAAIAKTDALLKSAGDYNGRAQRLELKIYVALAKAVQSKDQARAAELLSMLANLEDYDRALVVSLGSLQTLHDILPFSSLNPDQFWRVEGALKGTESVVDVGTKGVDRIESALK